MRLKRLVLENVCQHKRLEHTWHHGLNGIVGPNGSGKSNIVKAVKFAITGEFDNAGTKAENIYQLARDKARASVTLEFEHNGTTAKVIRILRGGTSSCQIGGGEQIDGDMAVTAAVMDLLCMDKRILSEYIFVPQRNMAAFVDETPGERNKTFGQLFNLALAEFLYKMLDADIKRTAPAPPSAELGPLQARIATGQTRKHELTNLINSSAILLKKLDVPAAKKLVEQADRWSSSKAAIDTLKQQVEQTAAELEVSRDSLVAAESERAELQVAKDEAASDVKAAKTTLARWETARLRRQREEVIRAREADLEAEPKSHPEPQLPQGGKPSKEAVRKKLDEVKHEIRIREELIAKFKDNPKVCPTCGAETDAILKKAEIYKADLPALIADRTKADKAQAAWVKYELDNAAWQQWHQDYSNRVIALSMDWETFKAAAEEAPVAKPDACREVIDAGEALERAIIETDARMGQLRQEVNRWAAKLDQDSMKLTKLEKERGTEPDPAAVVKARQAIAQAGPVEQMVNRATGERDAVVTNLQADGEMLTRLVEAERKAETDRLWVYHLNEIRKVMHHDQLPKVVAHNYLEILADDTNELLESFDADFRVGLGEGLNFTATFLRGPYAGTVSPAQRLSEGQKVLLALAFRVAVNSLFAGASGLLCLDEPTESLDERNLACLEVAIGKMRDLSESRGLQCLLITHEPSFEVLFDGVLRLVA
jgi:DNA repair exonuclease SbcCD ATPase subunit